MIFGVPNGCSFVALRYNIGRVTLSVGFHPQTALYLTHKRFVFEKKRRAQPADE